jgi:restriction system protein
MTRLWLVRAGKNGERESAALAQGLLAPGFLEVGDLSEARDRDAVCGGAGILLPSSSNV